jgi:hypothetical protein
VDDALGVVASLFGLKVGTFGHFLTLEVSSFEITLVLNWAAAGSWNMVTLEVGVVVVLASSVILG